MIKLIQSDIDKAGGLAEQLALKVRSSNGNLSTVYYKLEEILINYRKTGGDQTRAADGIHYSGGYDRPLRRHTLSGGL